MTRIGLLSLEGAHDPRGWSGIPHRIHATLRGLGLEVRDLGPLRVPLAPVRHRAAVAAAALGRSYRYELDGACIRAFRGQARERVLAAEVDAVLATSVLPVADLPSTVPVAVWCDATIEDLVREYPGYARATGRQRRNGRAAERLAFARADVLAFASPWASASAVRGAGADLARVVDAPFGASLVPPGSFDPVAAIAGRTSGLCRLVWVGADWDRKQGTLCVDVGRHLQALGIPVELTMVGDRPPQGEVLPDFVTHLGYVGQAEPADRARLSQVLGAAHFLLLPSRAEAFGIVIAEANAHAVPCLAADVGGIPGAIREGENGRLLPVDATARDYADLVREAMADPDGYVALARGALAAQRDRLDWASSCGAILERLLPGRS